MSRIGKVLVILTTGMSIVFLFWAIAVTQEKPDWFTEKLPNRADLVAMSDEIKDLNEGNKAAATRWGYNVYSVYIQETDRPRRRDFYRKALIAVETGDVPEVKGGPPVRQLTTDASGLVVPEFSRQPIEAHPGEALDSIAAYERKNKDIAATIGMRQQDIAEKIKEEVDLTALIHGTQDKKGLRTFITEQEDIRRELVSELAYILPFWVNRYAEHNTLLKRVHQMEERLHEMEKYEEARGDGR